MLAAHSIKIVSYLGCQTFIKNLYLGILNKKIIGVTFWNNVIIEKQEISMDYRGIGKIGSRLQYGAFYKQPEQLIVLEQLVLLTRTDEIGYRQAPLLLNQTTV